MDPRQAAITTGQSFNIAAQLLTAQADYEYRDTTIGELAVIADDVAKVILDAQETAEAVTRVDTAFPGTQTSTAPQGEPFPAVSQQVAPQAAQYQQQPPAPQYQASVPSPIPGATKSKDDVKWEAYFAAPHDYYDNRGNKKNPAGPDFKHKQNGDGLWLGGRYPAPQWVTQRLGVG